MTNSRIRLVGDTARYAHRPALALGQLQSATAWPKIVLFQEMPSPLLLKAKFQLPE
jgi:hypothetical protein